ncbi:MAG: hypothetical protein ACTSWY_02485, partial [Promethearchaeota archaeon]
MNPQNIKRKKFDSSEELKRREAEDAQIEKLDRLFGSAKTYASLPSDHTPFNVISTEQFAQEIVEPNQIEVGTRRLMAGTGFKMAEMLITGTIAAV